MDDNSFLTKLMKYFFGGGFNLKIQQCRFENLPIFSSSYKNMLKQVHIKMPFTF